MRLKSIELSGFKSFAKKTELAFETAVTAVVGPNGSGKSNVAESFRFVLGEQSIKSLRGKRGEDLIWNGSNAVPRAGRASVKLVLDNADRSLALDFDEVILERVVHRDGANEYRLNGAPVRLRDISELLSKAGIGASGHHIISQGEADRALSASPRERRAMLEDALGLTQFLYKREEAEKKLQKTAEHMREVESLRRELAPHLNFLNKQAKKIEDTEKTREELQAACADYFSREQAYITLANAQLSRERAAPVREKMEVEALVVRLKLEVQAAEAKSKTAPVAELARAEGEYARVRQEREGLMRDFGRLEGELAAHEALQRQEKGLMPAPEAFSYGERIAAALDKMREANEETIHALFEEATRLAHELVTRAATEMNGAQEAVPRDAIVEKMRAAEGALRTAREREEFAQAAVAVARKRVDAEKDAGREAEKKLFEALSRKSELEAAIARTQARADELERDTRALQDDVRAAAIVLGRGAFAYETHALVGADGMPVSDETVVREPRAAQQERRRKTERLKIRVEESGVANAAEILKEQRDMRERDEFLERELRDIHQTSDALRALIADLTHTLHEKFDAGLRSVSAEFDIFFKEVFGGGEASLSVIARSAAGEGEEEDDAGVRPSRAAADEAGGIEVAISLPHKRVKSLSMLSGGERALTSIALIFALSHINPPPLLILDETDAALDEANARRYGNVIARLAQRSQLIVVTHNRETMSHAGVLYGVTMGADGTSKVLSVKFEEAAAEVGK